MRRGVPIASIAAPLAALALAASAQAAAPANDAFGAPATLEVGDEISATNLEATSEDEEPEPAVVGADECVAVDSAPACGSSVWYAFEAPESVQYTIDTCDRGTDIDSVLGVYTGTELGALSLVKANDDACAGGTSENGSLVSFMATAGTVYSVDVTGFTAERGSFYLRAYQGSAQAYSGPDTAIYRNDSYAGQGLRRFGDYPGVLSGPRHSASFTLEGTISGSTFECALDGSAFEACTSPVSYDDLASGSSHIFAARSSAEGFTDQTPVLQRFTIDDGPPETAIEMSPLAETPSTSLAWGYSSSRPHLDSRPFTCGIDLWSPIGCETTFEVEDLCQGEHEFRVAAWDLAGNVDPTPATSTVKVTGGSPCAPPTIGAPTPGLPGDTDSGELSVSYDDQGAGGVLSIEYGKTNAYGSDGGHQVAGPSPSSNSDYFILRFLEPETTYHYKMTLATPFGTVSTPDETFNTASLDPGAKPPIVENGTPRVVGLHAVELPVSVDGRGLETSARVLIDGGEVDTESLEIFAPDNSFISSSESGPRQRSVEIVDLDPGTYHYRFFAGQNGPASTSTLGPEGTFSVPATTPGPTEPNAPAAFKLKRKNVKFGKLKRSSKKLVVKVTGLPAKTKLRLQIKVGKRKQTATKKAAAKGKAKFKVTLSKRIRKALRDHKVKKASLRVTATPPGGKPSSVSVKQKLKP